MTWFYKGKPIESIEDIPDPKAIGFIYIIRQISTGKKYIGRKLLTKSSRKTVKGKTKKSRTESDWKDYWSSSPELKQLIKDVGEQDFTREILVFVSSRGMLAYAEELSLYMVGALESDEWFNNNIRAKIYRSWCKPEEAKLLRESLKNL